LDSGDGTKGGDTNKAGSNYNLKNLTCTNSSSLLNDNITNVTFLQLGNNLGGEKGDSKSDGGGGGAASLLQSGPKGGTGEGGSKAEDRRGVAGYYGAGGSGAGDKGMFEKNADNYGGNGGGACVFI
jgi:hypothetical protein